MATIDILIPTCGRPGALAVTLCGLISQTYRDFRIVLSDQTEHEDAERHGEVAAVLRVLRAHGHEVTVRKHLPRRGMAEQRQFLLEQSTAPYVLYIDDDVILEADLVESMLETIREEGCGFVGCALHGLGYIGDVRPHQQAIELWDGPVQPELVQPGSPEWARAPLHSAANLYHVQQRLGLAPGRRLRYKVAWVGGCTMYDAAKLRSIGGFGFWRQLPVDHCGEDVLAQLRVMAHYGGCGVLPSGIYHQELPTTVPDRRINAPEVLPIIPDREGKGEDAVPDATQPVSVGPGRQM